MTNRADWGSPVEGAGTAAIDGAIDAEISGRYLPSVLSQLSNETSASTFWILNCCFCWVLL